MCVDITKRVNRPTRRIVKAWKIIKLDSDPEYWRPWGFSQYVFKRGKWMEANHPDYGFQAFADERKAKWNTLRGNERLVKVRMRKIEGYGTDYLNRRVIFAREIFVPKKRGK